MYVISALYSLIVEYLILTVSFFNIDDRIFPRMRELKKKAVVTPNNFVAQFKKKKRKEKERRDKRNCESKYNDTTSAGSRE